VRYRREKGVVHSQSSRPDSEDDLAASESCSPGHRAYPARHDRHMRDRLGCPGPARRRSRAQAQPVQPHAREVHPGRR